MSLRLLTVIEFISLDGVIQSPGSPEEDPSGGFNQGGWISGHVDEQFSEILRKEMASDFDLILGRRTYDIWSDYWPQHSENWPQVMRAAKYVVSRGKASLSWERSRYLGDDIIQEITRLKKTEGPELRVYGSSVLVPELIRFGLVDELRLRVCPVILGQGKRLFSQDCGVVGFNLEQCDKTGLGILILNYRRKENE